MEKPVFNQSVQVYNGDTDNLHEPLRYIGPTPVIVGLQRICGGSRPGMANTPIHLNIQVQTVDGPMDVCITEGAAAQLATAIASYLGGK
jgi:hypothetical protein